MSLLQKIETNSYCVVGRHYSGTNKLRGFITAKETKKLIVLNVRQLSQ